MLKMYSRIDLLTWIPSEHFMNDRMDRYMDIIQSKSGFGSFFAVVIDRGDSYECITNTGVLVVLSKATYNGKRILITAYAPKVDKIYAMCSSVGMDRVPHWLTEKVAEWEWLRQRDAKRQELARRNEFEAHKKNKYKC